MLHGSETWPVRKENEVALQRVEMRMVRWMCKVNVKDRVSSKELTERLEIDYTILILQPNRLRWCGHALPFLLSILVFIFSFFISLFCLVPCGRLSWLFASFWAHVNILHRYRLRKEDTDWVKKYMAYEVDQRGHGERLCKKIAKHVI